MSIQSTVSSFLAATFALTLAGAAFARQPPALTAAQRASVRAIVCEGRTPSSSAGYREVAARFDTRTDVSPAQVAGYRGKFVQPGAASAASQVACTSEPRLSASR